MPSRSDRGTLVNTAAFRRGNLYSGFIGIFEGGGIWGRRSPALKLRHHLKVTSPMDAVIKIVSEISPQENNTNQPFLSESIVLGQSYVAVVTKKMPILFRNPDVLTLTRT